MGAHLQIRATLIFAMPRKMRKNRRSRRRAVNPSFAYQFQARFGITANPKVIPVKASTLGLDVKRPCRMLSVHIEYACDALQTVSICLVANYDSKDVKASKHHIISTLPRKMFLRAPNAPMEIGERVMFEIVVTGGSGANYVIVVGIVKIQYSYTIDQIPVTLSTQDDSDDEVSLVTLGVDALELA